MLTAVGVAALTLALAGTATAATTVAKVTPSAPNNAVTSHVVASNGNSEQSAAAITRYWTPARMKNAIPVGSLSVPSSLARPLVSQDLRAGSAAPVTLTRPRGSSDPGAPRTMNLTTSAAQGKVFFTDPTTKLNYVCSGGTINNPKKDMVFTAGHCINTGHGVWMTNWMYVPAYYNGSTPYGKYPGRVATAFNQWILHSNYNYDVGIVNVYPYLGVDLVNYTGGNGLEYSAGYPIVTVWSYPAAPPYNGQLPYYCLDIPTYSYGSRIMTGCAMTSGASGGLWLTEYNTKSGLGYDNAVTSTSVSGRKGFIASPYFGSDIGTLYDSAKNL
jgi:hypothetical protein